jgi:AraC family L-rhamnose operon transcriptional activator RhaR/AraC family L-rhamnose operon regulatory protein RhaS
MVEFYSSERYLLPYDTPVRLLLYRQYRNRPHYHDFHELVIVADGSGEHCADGKVYRISAGDVFVIKPGMVHHYLNPVNLTLANILFDAARLTDLLPDIADIPGYFALFETEPEFRLRSNFKGKHSLDAAQLADVRDILSRMDAESSRRTPGHRLAVRTLFQQLVLYLARSYSDDERKHSRRMTKLSQMTKFIEEHFRRDISRDAIMAKAGVSVSVGSRIFQEFLRETPIGYLLRTRINHASELLRRTDLPITEVALQSGFRDSNYFSLQFRKITGRTPRECRREFKDSSTVNIAQ